MNDECNPTLDEIQRAARKFRHSNSVMALREVLERITGEAITVVSDVPESQRAAVIAALEGRSASSLLTADGRAVDPGKVYARWNRKSAP